MHVSLICWQFIGWLLLWSAVIGYCPPYTLIPGKVCVCVFVSNHHSEFNYIVQRAIWGLRLQFRVKLRAVVRHLVVIRLGKGARECFMWVKGLFDWQKTDLVLVCKSSSEYFDQKLFGLEAKILVPSENQMQDGSEQQLWQHWHHE